MQPALPPPYDMLGSSGAPQAPLDGLAPTAPISSDFLAYLMQHQMDAPAAPAEAATRGTWTKHEDDLLAHAVAHLGPTKWIDVAKFVPSRTAKQCRERWYNRLSPALKKVPFEAWEDQVIVEKQKELGNRWALIAQSLPGRSAGAVKNRWHAGLKAAQGLPHVSMIGQPL
jgi:hypothetical protein